MKKTVVYMGLTAGGLMGATPSNADGVNADEAAGAYHDWTGFYFGGHFGDAWGTAEVTARDSAGEVFRGSAKFYQGYDALKGTGSYYAGFQGGYNYKLPSGILLGFELDISAPNTLKGTQALAAPLLGPATYAETINYFGTARGRLGYAHGNWLMYATGGFAWSHDQFERMQLEGTPTGGTALPGSLEKGGPQWRTGWAAGGGVEVGIAPHWTANLQYMLTVFGTDRVSFPAAAQQFTSDLTGQSVRIGFNYQFPEQEKNSERSARSTDWALYGQTSYVQQYALPFHAPYRGANSLDSGAGRETWDAMFFAGVRLWPGAELWINPEIDQGFGLSGTLGVAGFTSGEAYKVGANYPYARLPRMFVRQTLDLGGESEKIDAGPNQMAGTQTKDRLIVTVGKFSVTDVFDTNKYAHDPRGDFLNWALVDTGTFDYAADAWGFTYGAAVEWYRGPWTLRAGLFDLSIVPNSTDLDPTFKQVQWVGEVERRYSLWQQPSKLTITAFLTRGRMGTLADAVALAQLTEQPADASLVRHYQSKTGIGFNWEQQISPMLGVFARGSLASGNVEAYEFTDIDRTLAAGLVLAGRAWGRPDDTFGIAGVINGISADHRAYFNAGGLGVLIGDGQLPHPGGERIMESYYSFPFLSWRMSLDYQFIDNPGYNQDRGPVSVIGTRLRKQF